MRICRALLDVNIVLLIVYFSIWQTLLRNSSVLTQKEQPTLKRPKLTFAAKVWLMQLLVNSNLLPSMYANSLCVCQFRQFH